MAGGRNRCELLSLRHRHRLLRQFQKEIQPAVSAMQPPYPIFSSVIKLNEYSPALTQGLPKDWNLSPKKNRIRRGKISEDCHVCHRCQCCDQESGKIYEDGQVCHLCQCCDQESGRKRKQAISAICDDCHVCHLCHLWRLLLCVLLYRASMESLPCLEDDHNKLNKTKTKSAHLCWRERDGACMVCQEMEM